MKQSTTFQYDVFVPRTEQEAVGKSFILFKLKNFSQGYGNTGTVGRFVFQRHTYTHTHTVCFTSQNWTGC